MCFAEKDWARIQRNHVLDVFVRSDRVRELDPLFEQAYGMVSGMVSDHVPGSEALDSPWRVRMRWIRHAWETPDEVEEMGQLEAPMATSSAEHLRFCAAFALLHGAAMEWVHGLDQPQQNLEAIVALAKPKKKTRVAVDLARINGLCSPHARTRIRKLLTAGLPPMHGWYITPDETAESDNFFVIGDLVNFYLQVPTGIVVQDEGRWRYVTTEERFA